MNNDDCNRYKVYEEFGEQAARFKMQAEETQPAESVKIPGLF